MKFRPHGPQDQYRDDAASYDPASRELHCARKTITRGRYFMKIRAGILPGKEHFESERSHSIRGYGHQGPGWWHYGNQM